MSNNSETQPTDFIEIAGDIVSAYVSNNSLPPAELPGLIQSIYAALTGLANGIAKAPQEEAIEKPTPAQIKKSVTPDGIISFVDGKTYKTMKRHLGTHGLDPHSYRERFGLPVDYPMVAPAYAAMRSELAKSIGLGRVADRSEDQKSTGRKKAA